jgi:hypothetical protein
MSACFIISSIVEIVGSILMSVGSVRYGYKYLTPKISISPVLHKENANKYVFKIMSKNGKSINGIEIRCAISIKGFDPILIPVGTSENYRIFSLSSKVGKEGQCGRRVPITRTDEIWRRISQYLPNEVQMRLGIKNDNNILNLEDIINLNEVIEIAIMVSGYHKFGGIIGHENQTYDTKNDIKENGYFDPLTINFLSQNEK